MINTIICNNCAGGAIMHDLGMEFRTPTVNLQILPEQFPKFCKNISYYLTSELTQCTDPEEPYAGYLKTMFWGIPSLPMGLINDVLVVFQHYDSFEDAKAKWDERRMRVDYNSMGFLFHARGPEYKQTAKEFMALDIPNKLCLTQNFSIPGSVAFEGEGFSTKNGKLLITQVYDFRSWIDSGNDEVTE